MAKTREEQLAYQRAQYAKHREKRLAAKAREYADNVQKHRERNKRHYAENAEANREKAREYRKENRETVNRRAMERYYADWDAISQRRKEIRKKTAKENYRRTQEWRQRNPERELIYHAKRLLSEQTGIPVRDISEDIAQQKAEQILAFRALKKLIDESGA